MARAAGVAAILGPMSVIVTCAVTGGSHTPTMNSDIPITIEEHIDQSVAAAEAGASVIHIHARDPMDGRPVSDVGVFREYCSGIKARSDAVISITTGGATGQTIEERLRVIATIRADFWDRPLRYPEMAQVLETSAITITPLAADDPEIDIER